MKTRLEQRILQEIGSTRMIASGDRVGVAVSGGADSVALLCLLQSLRNALGITLLVAHFDHSLRGTESDGDERFVAGVASERGLEYVSAKEDVASAAAENKWNLEDAARRLRYAFFRRLVIEGRANRIAVAHTADDQAETVMAHLLRGTGLAGLGGIRPVAGSIVRPLLGVGRQELRDFLEARGQSWREDSTNRDARRQRARIREQLLPVLARDFSPGIVDRLTDLAGICREEETFWSALVEERFRLLCQSKNGRVAIAIDLLISPLALPLAEADGTVDPDGSSPTRVLTKRLIRRLYEEVRGDCRDLASNHVDQVIRLACRSISGRHLELPGGIAVERNFGELIFSRAGPVARESAGLETGSRLGTYQYLIPVPEHGATIVSIPELDTGFRLKMIDWPSAERDTTIDSTVFDADLLSRTLLLRNWHPGDAYRPCGHRQVKKLKEMFLTSRVPKSERTGWPVIESKDKVIWARGMRPAGDVCPRKETRAGLILEEIPLATR
jgi:tRNA(Ile)-lysidine synthase